MGADESRHGVSLAVKAMDAVLPGCSPQAFLTASAAA